MGSEYISKEGISPVGKSFTKVDTEKETFYKGKQF